MRDDRRSASSKSRYLLTWCFCGITAASLPRGAEAHSGPHGGVDQPPEPTGASPFVVVAQGLANPRDIVLDRGAMYVVEAGRGARTASASEICIDSFYGDYHDCYGDTGAVARIKDGVLSRPFTRLPSIAGPNGGYAIGPSHVSIRGRSIFLTVSHNGGASRRAVFDAIDPRFGKLLELVSNCDADIVADLSKVRDDESAGSEDLRESNPAGLSRAEQGGFLAVDAGANTVLRVDGDGKASLRYVFSTRPFPAPPSAETPPGTMVPVQSVPVSVVRGPDGADYVAEFTGFPYPVGAARVHRFVGDEEPTVYATNFTNIIDLAFDAHGALFVLEMATHGLLSGDVTGAVVKVSAKGERTVIASQGLAYPTAIAVGADGGVYVANYGVSGTKAQVVRVR